MFFAPRRSLLREGVPDVLARAIITGDVVRDWRITDGDWALVPYDAQAVLVPLDSRNVGASAVAFPSGVGWSNRFRRRDQRRRRRTLVGMVSLGRPAVSESARQSHSLRGHPQPFRARSRRKGVQPLRTGDQAAVGGDGRRTSGSLGVLNSSTACFWLKQNSHRIRRSGVSAAIESEAWTVPYEFTGTTLQDYPLPGCSR